MKMNEIKKDSYGLGGSMRLWIPTVEEELEDVERRKSVSRVDTSANEKNLSEDDKQILLQQVLKGGVRSDADEEFFGSEANIQEESGETVTPTKPVKDEIPDEPSPDPTPEEKRMQAKILRLSQGAALTAYRAQQSDKFRDTLEVKKDKMNQALQKVNEAKEKIAGMNAEAGGDDSADCKPVIKSYLALMEAMENICNAWFVEIKKEVFDAVPQGPLKEELQTPTEVKQSNDAFLE